MLWGLVSPQPWAQDLSLVPLTRLLMTLLRLLRLLLLPLLLLLLLLQLPLVLLQLLLLQLALPRLSALHLVVLCPVQCTFSPGLPHTPEVWADKPGTVLATSLGPRTSGPGLGWGLVQALTAPMLTFAPMPTRTTCPFTGK